jgi:hypothetical protein
MGLLLKVATHHQILGDTCRSEACDHGFLFIFTKGQRGTEAGIASSEVTEEM